MKRLLPLGIALLVVTACAAGTKPVGFRLHHPSVKAVAAAREREAERKAERLLHRIVLPPGARRTRQPDGVQVLSHSGLGTSMLTEFAERHGFWRVQAPLATVVDFVKSHRLPRFDQASSAGSGRGERPVWQSLDFYGPVVHGRPVQRLYTITAVAFHGSTVVRADVGAAWIYPRSSREVLPSDVSEVDIRGEHVARRVTDQAKVTRILSWFGALNVVPPGAHVICGALVASNVRFVFRSASGAKLATAIAPSRPGDACDPITFSIRGRRQRPLVDAIFGRRAFVNRVQRLLGVRFPTR
jgi:hypothetical protein